MRRKLLVIFTLVLVCVMAITLVACKSKDNGDNTPAAPAHEHTYSDEWESDDTYHWHAATCEHTDEISGRAEHTWDDGDVTTEATENAEGVKTYTCTVCGKTKTEVIPMKNHTHTWASDWTIDKEATCTEEGSKSHHCTKAGCSGKNDVTTVAKIAHTFTAEIADSKYLKSDATCTDDAVYYKSCSVCGAIGTDTFTKLGTAKGHTFAESWSKDATYHWHAATCEHTDEVSGKAIHTWNDGVQTKAPTEEEQGEMTYTCTVCGQTKTEPIAKLNHTCVFDQEKVDAMYLKSAATCTEKAVYYKSCACGVKGTETFTYGEALMHEYGEWIDEVPATCEMAGTKGHYQCTMCKQNFGALDDKLESLVIPALGHTYGTWIAEIPATCETAGTLGHYHCDGCGKDFDTNHNELASLVINATGHTYATVWSKDATKHWYASTCGCDVKKDEATHTFNYKGVCTVCGYDSCSTLSLGYTFDDDNSKGTENAEQNTKWYAKVSLTNETTYLASCTNINQYEIKICDKDGLELCEFSSENNYFYQFNATYTGDYYISILKSGSGNYKPIFYIASVQNMTSPFVSDSASNSATYSAREFKAFSFTIAADCSIKLNGAFGEDDYMEIISSDMENIYTTSWDEVNGFQVVEDLPAGTYYFVDYYQTAGVTVNYYLVCGHEFGNDNVCDVCGYTCTHTNKNAYDICDNCGQFLGHTDVVANGDSVYPDTSDGDVVYRFELTAGTYKIIEELGTDCAGYNYYLFVEGASDTEYLNKGADTKTITITEGGIYYLVVEDEYSDYENGGNSFQLLEVLTSNLIANGSYTATSIADKSTYYYIIDITTAGVYTFTYDEDIDGDVVNDISIVGQTAIDGSTDYKLAVGRYILQVDAGTVVGGDILIQCVYSQCISTDGSLTEGLTVAHGGKVYFQIDLEEGDYSVRAGSTLDIILVFKDDGVVVGNTKNNSFSTDEEYLGEGTYYVVAYNAGADTTTGAFGIQ